MACESNNRCNLLSFRQLLVDLNRPLPEWGPAKPEDRTIPRYQHLLPPSPQTHATDPNAVALSINNGSESPPSYDSGSKEVDGYDNPGFQQDSFVVTKM